MKNYAVAALCLCSLGGDLAARKRFPVFKADPPHYAYVTDYLDNAVSVINTDTNTPVTTLLVGNKPIDIVAGANGSVYVLNFDGTVTVINSATNEVSGSIHLDLDIPTCISVNPAGTVLYAGENYNAVGFVKFNLTANAVSGSGMVRVTSMVPSPNGQDLFLVLNRQVLIDYNLTTNTPTTITGPWFELNAMAMNPGGTTLYVADGFGFGNNVYAVNLASKQVTAVIPVGVLPDGLQVSADGNTLYAANYTANTVSVISTANNQVVTTVPVGKGPYGIAISKAGLVYVVNHLDNSVSVIDPVLHIVTSVISIGSGAMKIAVQ